MECQNCKFVVAPGEAAIDGVCPNCQRPYREQPSPLHSEMEMRNMPAPGEEDSGGNPLQEGILGGGDGGWKNFKVRDESFASVQSNWQHPVQGTTNGYAEACLWANDDGAPGGEYQADHDHLRQLLPHVQDDVRDFINGNPDAYNAALQDGYTPEQIGHDFYLTRNGHGTGFWDRGGEPSMKALDQAARTYGASDDHDLMARDLSSLAQMPEFDRMVPHPTEGLPTEDANELQKMYDAPSTEHPLGPHTGTWPPPPGHNQCTDCGNDLGQGSCGFREVDGKTELLCHPCWAENRKKLGLPTTIQHPNLGFEMGEHLDPGPQKNDPRWSRTADYQGWSNWDTWNTKLMMDNEQDLQNQSREIAEHGPDALRDWALHHIIGPHNQQAIEDSKEWNSIPEEDRVDHHYEDLKNQSPDAADLVGQMGFGPDVSDDEPTLIDHGAVNWNEIHQSIANEKAENEEWERQQQEQEPVDQGWSGSRPSDDPDGDAYNWKSGEVVQDRSGHQAEVTRPYAVDNPYLGFRHISPGESHHGQEFTLHPSAVLNTYQYRRIPTPTPQQLPHDDSQPGNLTMPDHWGSIQKEDEDEPDVEIPADVVEVIPPDKGSLRPNKKRRPKKEAQLGALLALGARLLPGIGRIMGGAMRSGSAQGLASKLGPGLMAGKALNAIKPNVPPASPGGPPPGPQGTPGNLPIPPAYGKENDDPSSVSIVPGQKSDDPEDVDPHEKNDGQRDLDLQVGPDVNDMGGTDQGPDFNPQGEGAQHFEALLPKLLELLLSDASGADDPEVQDLHNKLDAEVPGYLNQAGSDEDGAHMLMVIMGGDPQQAQADDPALQDNDQPHDPISDDPTDDEGLKESRFTEHMGALPGIQPFVPMQDHSQAPMDGLEGKCPMCHATLDPTSALCPQCGMGNSPTRMAADVQGPNSDEQKAALAESLGAQGRGEEIPNMILHPEQYADELAQLIGEDTPPDAPNDPSGPANPATTLEGAPPDAGMPVPGMGGPQQMMAALHRYTNQVDTLADPCPNCDSHSTGYQDEDGNCHCKTCNHQWKSDPLLNEGGARTALVHDEGENAVGVPAADQEGQYDSEQDQDPSHTWPDINGQPLRINAEYKMYSDKYSIPDIIRVTAVKPEAFEYTNVGEFGLDHSAEVSYEEAQLENLQFEPFNGGGPEGIEDSGTEENMEDIGRPSPGQDQTDLSTPHMQMAKTAMDPLPWDPNHPTHPDHPASGNPPCPNCGRRETYDPKHRFCEGCGYDEAAQSEQNYFNQMDPAFHDQGENPYEHGMGGGDPDDHYGKQAAPPGYPAPEETPDLSLANGRWELPQGSGIGPSEDPLANRTPCPKCNALLPDEIAKHGGACPTCGMGFGPSDGGFRPFSNEKTANPESINLEPNWENFRNYVLTMAKTDLQQAVRVNNELAGEAIDVNTLAQAAGVSPQEVEMMSGGMNEVADMTGPEEGQHPLGPHTGVATGPFPYMPPEDTGEGYGYMDSPKEEPTNTFPCGDCGTQMNRYRGMGDMTCPKCGAEHNSFGQRLAPRSQWGEETGETPGDIYGPDPESLGYPYEARTAKETGPAWLLEGLSHTAGAKFTPTEQKDFIEEGGEARNMDKLDLDGTHYEAAAEAQEMFPFGGL